MTAASLPDPAGIEVVKASTVDEMKDAIVPASSDADLLVMAAAISDFTPARVSAQKIKKKGSGDMTLELAPVDDFMPLAHGRRLVKVAFAAETHDVEANAAAKAAPKGAAFVVANDVSEPGSGFGTDTNRVTFVDADGSVEAMPLMSKLDVAHAILDRALPLLANIAKR